MVDHDQNTIVAVGFGEIGDEIHRDILEWPSNVVSGDWLWGRGGWVCVWLVLLACGTAFDVSGYHGIHAGPPV